LQPGINKSHLNLGTTRSGNDLGSSTELSTEKKKEVISPYKWNPADGNGDEEETLKRKRAPVRRAATQQRGKKGRKN